MVIDNNFLAGLKMVVLIHNILIVVCWVTATLDLCVALHEPSHSKHAIALVDEGWNSGQYSCTASLQGWNSGCIHMYISSLCSTRGGTLASIHVLHFCKRWNSGYIHNYIVSLVPGCINKQKNTWYMCDVIWLWTTQSMTGS